MRNLVLHNPAILFKHFHSNCQLTLSGEIRSMRLYAYEDALMNDLAAFLSALSEPTRLGALRMLADGREHCVCELMLLLGATQSRMSRHMGVLKAVGIVTDRRDAQWIRYRRNPNLPVELDTILNAVINAADVNEVTHPSVTKRNDAA